MILDEKSVRAIWARARRLAREHHEVCGLLVDHGGLVTLVETRNKSDRRGSFWIHPLDWRAIERAAALLGSRVVGTFHSHPASEPVPGTGDLRGAVHGHAMIIFDATMGDLCAWRIRKGRAYRLRYRFYRELANKPLQRTGASVALRAPSRARR
jgi:proteasome lid subunit RPN8/RPN11